MPKHQPHKPQLWRSLDSDWSESEAPTVAPAARQLTGLSQCARLNRFNTLSLLEQQPSRRDLYL